MDQASGDFVTSFHIWDNSSVSLGLGFQFTGKVRAMPSYYGVLQNAVGSSLIKPFRLRGVSVPVAAPAGVRLVFASLASPRLASPSNASPLLRAIDSWVLREASGRKHEFRSSCMLLFHCASMGWAKPVLAVRAYSQAALSLLFDFVAPRTKQVVRRCGPKFATPSASSFGSLAGSPAQPRQLLA